LPATSESVTSTTTVAEPSDESTTTSKTTVAVPSSPAESETPAQPTVTSPPSFNDGAQGPKGTGITSTITSTVYRDLSEVEDCPHACAA
jgi:hypothetical protein